MSLFSHWSVETRKLLSLAGPLIVNNLAIAGMQAADAMMAGKLGAETLAAVAVGGSVWFFMFTVVLGIKLAAQGLSGLQIFEGKTVELEADSIRLMIDDADSVGDEASEDDPDTGEAQLAEDGGEPAIGEFEPSEEDDPVAGSAITHAAAE